MMSPKIIPILLSLVVGTCALVTACSSQGTPPVNGTPSPSPGASSTAHEHTHEHAAPHGGVLVELGKEAAHLEVLFDATTGELVIYILDGEAEKAVRVAQKSMEITLSGREAGSVSSRLILMARGNPLTGESPGDSSEFRGHAPSLQGVDRIEGRVALVSVAGQQYADTRFVYQRRGVDRR